MKAGLTDSLLLPFVRKCSGVWHNNVKQKSLKRLREYFTNKPKLVLTFCLCVCVSASTCPYLCGCQATASELILAAWLHAFLFALQLHLRCVTCVLLVVLGVHVAGLVHTRSAAVNGRCGRREGRYLKFSRAAHLLRFLKSPLSHSLQTLQKLFVPMF